MWRWCEADSGWTGGLVCTDLWWCVRSNCPTALTFLHTNEMCWCNGLKKKTCFFTLASGCCLRTDPGSAGCSPLAYSHWKEKKRGKILIIYHCYTHTHAPYATLAAPLTSPVPAPPAVTHCCGWQNTHWLLCRALLCTWALHDEPCDSLPLEIQPESEDAGPVTETGVFLVHGPQKTDPRFLTYYCRVTVKTGQVMVAALSLCGNNYSRSEVQSQQGRIFIVVQCRIGWGSNRAD